MHAKQVNMQQIRCNEYNLAVPRPRSCDTFVALPPATKGSVVIFGKNSDRAEEEVQEVVSFGRTRHRPGSRVKCTYITIPQVEETLAVVLSKPTWMWGAEMGANEYGVMIGNEAVWTVEEMSLSPALLGMDLVRLGLERSKSAAEGVSIIAQLLETHGQGGPCEERGSWTYHNSFLLADAREAWVLETAGKWWVAERIPEGVRNISNCLSIRTTYHNCSNGLEEYARRQGLWDGNGDFDWTASFSSGQVPALGKKSSGREANGFKLLQEASGSGIDAAAMMEILRDQWSGVCMCGGGFRSNGSQVSCITSTSASHWFTATPDPSRSIYKPFRFPDTVLCVYLDDATPSTSPFTTAQSRGRNPPHTLWQAWEHTFEHSTRAKIDGKLSYLADLQSECLLEKMEFGEAVQRELNIYGSGIQQKT